MEQNLISILIDSRENCVAQHIPCYTSAALDRGITVSYDGHQLTIGDFAILNNDQILMIIERKTLKDLGVSLKDGRFYSQKEKMLDIRNKTGCRLVYVIENKLAFPVKTRKFSRIPYNNLIAAIRHAVIRDNILIMQSRDPAYTAEMIVDFACDFVKLYNEMPEEMVQLFPTSDTTNISNIIVGGREMLTQKQPIVDYNVVMDMWRSIGGISNKIAPLIMETYTLSDFICNQITVDWLAELKYASGARFGMKRAAAVIALLAPDKINDTCAKIFAAIPGITKNSAQLILTQYSAFDICANSSSSMSEAIGNIKKGKRRLGDKLAKKLLKYMNMKFISCST